MKKLSLTITFVVFLLISSNGTQAQTPQAKLNQLELVKQFVGTWNNETKKDTTMLVEITCFKNGAYELNNKTITKGKTISERKTLWGYDKKTGKFILGSIWNNSPDIALTVLYFTSLNTCEYYPYEYISNPEKAGSKTVYEFKSPDQFISTTYRNNKPAGISGTYNRIK